MSHRDNSARNNRHRTRAMSHRRAGEASRGGGDVLEDDIRVNVNTDTSFPNEQRGTREKPPFHLLP